VVATNDIYIYIYVTDFFKTGLYLNFLPMTIHVFFSKK
jgi:hypothetical protein